MNNDNLSSAAFEQQCADYQSRAKQSHLAVLFFYCALLALFSVHQLLRDEGVSLFQWCVQCLPLMIFWFGLRKRNRRTYLWMSFVLLLYFIKGVEGVMGFTPTVFDWLLLIFSTSLFIANTMTARWLMLREKIIYERNLQQASPATPQDDN